MPEKSIEAIYSRWLLTIRIQLVYAAVALPLLTVAIIIKAYFSGQAEQVIHEGVRVVHVAPGEGGQGLDWLVGWLILPTIACAPALAGCSGRASKVHTWHGDWVSLHSNFQSVLVFCRNQGTCP
jgi:hypothetical protein